MGKKIKKGTEGPQKEYVSRTKALKKLQVTMKDFRRICILKGIFPREPPKKLKKQHKTYYHVKDVAYLKSESILEKLRQRRAHLKKIRIALLRGDKLKARRLRRSAPTDNLDHLVKERYPTFNDALNDLDDPLCLISLFASFHAHKELQIPNEVIVQCQRQINQFLVYVAAKNCLRKVFLTIKGIYYQANIQNASITWIMPYPIQASLPLDVDYKVMMTFLEFYGILMRFVNFKLLGQELEASDVGDVVRQQRHAEQHIEIDDKFKDDPTLQQINAQQSEMQKYSTLFKGFKFFLYPEVPKQSLEFVILSFGGDVCWANDSRNSTENDTTITHVVLERNVKQLKHREYLQPQWVYDSINALKLLPISDYSPDKTLPPHLSPFEEQKIDVELSEDENSKKKEHKKLAETMLTKKNKRLYEMVKRKENEEAEKKKALQQKKKILQK